ncbi:cytochrome P450 [Trichoderma barbatum]
MSTTYGSLRVEKVGTSSGRGGTRYCRCVILRSLRSILCCNDPTYVMRPNHTGWTCTKSTRIPHNKSSVSKLAGDVGIMKKAQYRRQWIWHQPSKHNSPVSQVFIFPFRRPTVIVTDYRTVVHICSNSVDNFDRGTRNKECIGLIAPNFHFVMQTKDPAFNSHKRLAQTAQIYNTSDSLIKLWTLKASISHGKPFLADRDIHLATLDIICTVAFGTESLKSALQNEVSHVKSGLLQLPSNGGEAVCFSSGAAIPDLEALLNAPKMISVAQGSLFPRLSQFLALLNPKNGLAYWNRKVLIKRQKEMGPAGSGECRCALDQLLRHEMDYAKKDKRPPDYYSATIRDEILGYLIAGHDTTAATLSWWVKYMAKHQPVQSRLRNDLRQAYPSAFRDSRQPKIEEIYGAAVPYLDAVIEETLRYASVATLIVRTSACDTQICEYTIPKGTDVMLSLTGPSLTEPALATPQLMPTSSGPQEGKAQFKPERWLKFVKSADGCEREKFCPKAGPNLAFSSGPRQCYGKNLAYMQLRIIIVSIIWNFELQPLHQSFNGPEIIERLVTFQDTAT